MKTSTILYFWLTIGVALNGAFWTGFISIYWFLGGFFASWLLMCSLANRYTIRDFSRLKSQSPISVEISKSLVITGDFNLTSSNIEVDLPLRGPVTFAFVLDESEQEIGQIIVTSTESVIGNLRKETFLEYNYFYFLDSAFFNAEVATTIQEIMDSPTIRLPAFEPIVYKDRVIGMAIELGDGKGHCIIEGTHGRLTIAMKPSDGIE